MAISRVRSSEERQLVLLFCILVLAFLAVSRHKSFYYAILISPATDLLLAGFLAKLSWSVFGASRWATRRTLLLLGLLGASIISTLALIRNNPMDGYQLTLQRISRAVSAQSSVMGSQTYWFALPEHEYYSWQQLVYYRRYAPGSTLEDAFRDLRPDFLIIDRHMELFIAEERASLPNYFQFLSLPKADLERFLDQRANLVTNIETDTFGNVRVYKINWLVDQE
jgi:hypothetical protein